MLKCSTRKKEKKEKRSARAVSRWPSVSLELLPHFDAEAGSEISFVSSYFTFSVPFFLQNTFSVLKKRICSGLGMETRSKTTEYCGFSRFFFRFFLFILKNNNSD